MFTGQIRRSCLWNFVLCETTAFPTLWEIRRRRPNVLCLTADLTVAMHQLSCFNTFLPNAYILEEEWTPRPACPRHEYDGGATGPVWRRIRPWRQHFHPQLSRHGVIQTKFLTWSFLIISVDMKWKRCEKILSFITICFIIIFALNSIIHICTEFFFICQIFLLVIS